MTVTEKNTKNLDRSYDVFVILVTVIAATLFQQTTFIFPYLKEHVQGTNVTYESIALLTIISLRRLFIPIILSLLLWFTSLFTYKTKEIILRLNSWIQLLISFQYCMIIFTIYIHNPFDIFNITPYQIFFISLTALLIIFIMLKYDSNLEQYVNDKKKRFYIFFTSILFNGITLLVIELMIHYV